jgi:hypothetical protein
MDLHDAVTTLLLQPGAFVHRPGWDGRVFAWPGDLPDGARVLDAFEPDPGGRVMLWEPALEYEGSPIIHADRLGDAEARRILMGDPSSPEPERVEVFDGGGWRVVGLNAGQSLAVLSSGRATLAVPIGHIGQRDQATRNRGGRPGLPLHGSTLAQAAAHDPHSLWEVS